MTDDSHTAHEPHPTAAMDRQYRERDDEYAKLWEMYGELEDKCDRLREALDHALRGDLDPEDRVIIAQILDGAALQEGGDA